MFAGVVAVADQAARHDLGLLNPTLYADGDGSSSGSSDITAGNNIGHFVQPTSRGTQDRSRVTGFNAVPGYDLATGLGTANGARLVTVFELAVVEPGHPPLAPRAIRSDRRGPGGFAARARRRLPQVATVSAPSSREIATSIE